GDGLEPDKAYRFAKGEPITAHNGMVANIGRPLDFLVVADHAANMGLMTALAKGNAMIMETDFGKRWYQSLQSPLNYDLPVTDERNTAVKLWGEIGFGPGAVIGG